MGRKTFISYKYSESQAVRDRILAALGEDAQFYQGETADSPDQTDNSSETIKNNLRDMIFGTSVTIIVVSPNMTESKWIDWEIEFSLKETMRGDKVSRSNGIVGVIAKYNGNYDWLISFTDKTDGCKPSRNIKDDKLYEIIKNNRLNRKIKNYSCEHCKTFDILTGSYISLIEEDEFVSNPQRYIESAYEKSQKISEFNITKER